MNSDLSQTQSVTQTSNPQTTSPRIGASDSTQFQQSAGIEALSQSQTLEVVNTGEPIRTEAAKEPSATAYLPLILVILALVLLSARLYRWVKAAPVKVSEVPEPVSAPVVAARPKKKPVGKKKQSRSKRRNSR